MTVIEVLLTEPLKRSVGRHDFDELFGFDIAYPPIRQLMRVRDDQNVIDVVFFAQFLI